jgi:hypothetical protein
MEFSMKKYGKSLRNNYGTEQAFSKVDAKMQTAKNTQDFLKKHKMGGIVLLHTEIYFKLIVT